MHNDTRIRPIADQVLVRRDKAEHMTEGGLHLPDGAEHWPTTGKVLAVGNRVKEREITPGARVMFKSKPASALIRDEREPGQNKLWERVVVLREEDILCILEDSSAR